MEGLARPGSSKWRHGGGPPGFVLVKGDEEKAASPRSGAGRLHSLDPAKVGSTEAPRPRSGGGVEEAARPWMRDVARDPRTVLPSSTTRSSIEIDLDAIELQSRSTKDGWIQRVCSADLRCACTVKGDHNNGAD